MRSVVSLRCRLTTDQCVDLYVHAQDGVFCQIEAQVYKQSERSRKTAEVETLGCMTV